MAHIGAMSAKLPPLAMLGLALLIWVSPVQAEDSASRGLELRRLAYLLGVAEYCGLVSYEVYDGYHRETRAIIRRENLTENVWRDIRISGTVDADLQFGNHGIAGQRRWCQTDGMEAVTRFIAFRDAQLAQEQAADQ